MQDRAPAPMTSPSAPGAQLEGQVAIVTGAARGLGFATARRLLSDGARVALFDRDAEALRQAALRLSGAGPAEPLTVDVTEEQAVREAVRRVQEAHERIDILVNNAGIFPHAPFEDLRLAEWRRVLATNLDGVFLCTHAVYPAMRARGYGRIVNMSSATFFIGYPEMTSYIASKGGIVGFTRALASEAGPYGVTVNCITPGLIETEGSMEEDPTGELFEEIVGGQAIKRRGRPEDIAECVAYLVSPGAGYITGQTINVDGGHRYH
jgi:NAD(P)-dependent dehydrogenase (short-subunit alcohol dehydrogenase family)